MANLVRTISNRRVGHYIFSCIDCGTEYTRSANGKHINPYCAECSRKYQRQRQKEQAEARQRKHDAKVRADAIDECVKTIRNFAPDCVKLLEQLKEQENE